MDQEIIACKQLKSDGRLRHLLNLKGLDRSFIHKILNQSEQYLRKPGEVPARDDSLAGRTVAKLLFEASSRTRASFELAAKRISADAIVMHPGPMNRDVEISGEVAGGPQSTITQQVTNGLAVRMAILAAISGGRSQR
jgi:aspartate carbamoyltransferase catalytic subunit